VEAASTSPYEGEVDRTAAWLVPRARVVFLVLMSVVAVLLGTGVSQARADGSAIVAAAQAMQNAGYPYCFDGGTIHGPTVGTTDPDSDGSYSNCSQIGRVGFDCTGLTLYAVYQGTGDAGLSHDGYQAGSGGGQVIASRSELQPGDIVYFDYDAANGLRYIDHAGVYVGGGDVLSAVSEKWGIRTESIAWYEAGGLHFVGAKRYWTGGGGGPKANGSFVRTPNGSIYVVAGGAAIHVDSCAPLGGCPGLVELPNLAGYASEPANGTFLRVADGSSAGLIARLAGGVPLGLDTCEGIPECGSAVNIDSGGYSDYAAAHQTIANGTVLRVADGEENGLIGRVIGEVLLGFLSCEGIPECGSAVNVDEDAYNWYASQHHVIANGTVLRVANGSEAGLIGRVVGGVLLGFASCEGIPECGSAVEVSENAYNWYASQYHVIANGTVLRVANGSEAGLIGRVVGGVLLGFASCEGISECGSAVEVSENAYNWYASQYHVVGDGTFVRVANGSRAGLVARAAGGALIGLTTCVPLEECSGFVNVSENAFVAYVSEHPQPSNGTILEGLPSATYWVLANGRRQATSASAEAVAVDDGALVAFPILVPPPAAGPSATAKAPAAGVLTFRSAPVCRVPKLRHLGLAKARRRLAAAHCKLGNVSRHGRARALVVTHQSAPINSRHRVGYRVNVTVT
jgi:cell wall-associated NlpC family hydrolase